MSCEVVILHDFFSWSQQIISYWAATAHFWKSHSITKSPNLQDSTSIFANSISDQKLPCSTHPPLSWLHRAHFQRNQVRHVLLAPRSQPVERYSSKAVSLANHLVECWPLQSDPGPHHRHTRLQHAPAPSVVEGVVANVSINLSPGHVQN